MVGLVAVLMLLATSETLACEFSVDRYNGKNLTRVPMLQLRSSCGQLDISNNSINTLDDDSFRSFPRLRTLWAISNNISNVTEGAFQATKDLRVVDLSHNRLRHLPRDLFKGVTTRLRLYLHNNSIELPTRGSFLDAPELRSLDLSSCDIRVVPRETFVGMPKIEDLFLNQNKLKEVTGAVLYPLQMLSYLDISSTLINNLNLLANRTLSNLTLSVYNTSIVTLSSVDLQRVGRLGELNMSANVCCCYGVCEESLKLPGWEWKQRCDNCQYVSNGPGGFTTPQPSTRSTEPVVSTTTTRTDRGRPTEVKTSSSESIPALRSEEHDVVKTASIAVLAVLLVTLGGALGTVLVLRRRRARPKVPEPIPCACPCLLVHHHDLFVRDSNAGRATSTLQRKEQVTDLDYDDPAEYAINNIYELVDN